VSQHLKRSHGALCSELGYSKSSTCMASLPLDWRKTTERPPCGGLVKGLKGWDQHLKTESTLGKDFSEPDHRVAVFLCPSLLAILHFGLDVVQQSSASSMLVSRQMRMLNLATAKGRNRPVDLISALQHVSMQSSLLRRHSCTIERVVLSNMWLVRIPTLFSRE
jgi:hypothetical protein